MDSQEPNLFDTIPSPVPGELGFRLHVPQVLMPGLPALTPLVTTYGAAPLPNRLRSAEKLAGHDIAGFVFMGWDSGPAGYIDAVFHRLRSDTEIATKVDSLCGSPFSMERPWPAVLVHLGARENHDLPLTLEVGGRVVEVPRLFDDMYLIPGGSYACEINREVYVSHTDFPSALTTVDVPVPGPVQWNTRNLEGSLTCLHPDVRFDDDGFSGQTALANWGTVGTQRRAGQRRGQYFTATNHTTWRRHCFDVNETRTNDGLGLRVLTRLIAHPPRGFTEISRTS